MSGLGYIGLGLVPAASRRVQPIPKDIMALVPPPTDNDKTIQTTQPDVETETMPLIMNKMKRTAWQTKKLAAYLKGPTTAATLKNDCDFILKYIKYKEDDPNNEEIRSPRRLIYGGIGDCDCFAVTLGTLLLNQGIKFKARIAKYENGSSSGLLGDPDWQHIYIVVPKDQKSKAALTARSQYTVLDPVTNKYDYEANFLDRKDYDMGSLNGLKFLDGLGCDCNNASTCDPNQKPLIYRLRRYVPASVVIEDGLVPTRVFLTENKIKFTEGIDTSTNTGYFDVTTPSGVKRVSPIITRAESATLLPLAPAEQLPTKTEQINYGDVLRNMVTGTVTPTAVITTPVDNSSMQIAPVSEETKAAVLSIADSAKAAMMDSAKRNWWKWVAAAGVAYLVLKPSSPKPSVAGLSGVKRAAAHKPVHKSKKHKVIHI